MTSTDDSLKISENGLGVRIEPEDPGLRAQYEAAVRAEYERCHPGDTFDALKHRAQFSKEDQGLLRDWMIAAAQRLGRG